MPGILTISISEIKTPRLQLLIGNIYVCMHLVHANTKHLRAPPSQGPGLKKT